ncbi:MAG: hypothetical protein R3320_03495 [Nitriliruptorales bacterium]|nr:hypothetical protein [Nitriliruptorales bacterium]
MAVVTEVQITTHDGFDRLEFEIGGEMQVGWDVRYVESPRSQGSGDPVEVEGRAVLEVVLEPVVYPFDAPEGAEPYDGPKTLSPTVTSAIVHVVNDTIYEGRHVFFVGIDEVLPFRVQRADNPQRVVLEVLHPAD